MKNTRKYFLIATAGIVLWVGETAYFGFNQTPENGIEATLDIVSAILIVWGIIGDILTNVKVTKHYHNITNTKKLIYQDQRPNGKTVLGTKGK